MSLPKREVEMMTCAYCGRDKPWPAAYPNPHVSAECWECAWKAHRRIAHAAQPKPWWQPYWLRRMIVGGVACALDGCPERQVGIAAFCREHVDQITEHRESDDLRAHFERLEARS